MDLIGKVCVIVHRVSAEVHSRDLIFHMEQLVPRELLHRRDIGLIVDLACAVIQIKKAELAAHVVPCVEFNIIKHAFNYSKKLTAVSAKSVKSAALYKAFNGAAVHVFAVEPLAEVIE